MQTATQIVLWLNLFLWSFVAPPLLARRKGYDWPLWIFGGSVLGLIVLAFLPSANTSDLTPGQRTLRKRVGNRYGVLFSFLTIVVFFGGLIAFIPADRPRPPGGD